MAWFWFGVVWYGVGLPSRVVILQQPTEKEFKGIVLLIGQFANFSVPAMYILQCFPPQRRMTLQRSFSLKHCI